jgi:hypothetical protein
MAEGTTSTKKAVTTENLAALKDVLATKSHVTAQIEQAQLGGGVEFATDEEVLALFQETTPADTPVE